MGLSGMPATLAWMEGMATLYDIFKGVYGGRRKCTYP